MVECHLRFFRFFDLENEIETETDGEIDEAILRSVENVARFQYEDASSMPMAKVSQTFVLGGIYIVKTTRFFSPRFSNSNGISLFFAQLLAVVSAKLLGRCLCSFTSGVPKVFKERELVRAA